MLFINILLFIPAKLHKFTKYILTVLAGATLLAIPLLRDLHFESAMLAAVIGCFWAGNRAAKYTSRNDIFFSLKILGFLYIAAIPLFIYSLFTSCLTIDGIGFWLFIPFPSVFLGTTVGRLMRKLWAPFPQTITTLVLLFCALGILAIEFFNFPQVYFYNHVWGVWPGPVYDEAVHLSGSFFYFRWITFLWIVLLWVLPDWNKSTQTKLMTGLALISLLLSYINLDEMGVISPRQSIQQHLAGHHQSKHFDFYFDAEFYSEQEIRYWATRHEFHFQQITEKLEIDWPESRKIESYLYAHAWQKKKITGAKYTSYVPIWLGQDQLHIAKQQLDRVLKHELVHVISKQFGNRLFNGSWSIGLIEGLAEGIAKDASGRSTLHQIVAAEEDWPDAEEMKFALSFWGFYGSAGAISYTTSGSFVEYLLDEFPPDNFKTAYTAEEIENAYNQSFEELVSGWHNTLTQTELDSVDRQISEFIFAQRSLFQKLCPHSVTKELRLWDKYEFLLAGEDTAAAYTVLDELYQLGSENDFVLDEWVRAQLMQGNFEQGAHAITPNDTLVTLQVLKADALFLRRGFEPADSLLQIYAPEITASPARNFRYTLQLREDSLLWHHHTQRRFFNHLPDSITFQRLNYPNKMLSLEKTLNQKNERHLLVYASQLFQEEAHTDWFDIYEPMTAWLIFMGEFELAESWLNKIAELNLRLRYAERLQEQREWLAFMRRSGD